MKRISIDYIRVIFPSKEFKEFSKHCISNFGSNPQRQRRREAATLTIQSWTRGMLSRKQTKQELRQRCDSVLAQAKSQGITEPAATKLIALLIRIYNSKEDSERLVSLLCKRPFFFLFYLLLYFFLAHTIPCHVFLFLFPILFLFLFP